MQEWCWLVLDFETFYHTKGKYSLRVMDTPSYILDHRFEEIVCTFKENGGQTFALTPEEIPGYLARLRTRYKKIALISHNILFDACIACWKHGFVADLYVDTLSMSRTLLGHILARRDLGAVAKHLGLPDKGTAVHKMDGKTRAMIIAEGIYDEYVVYCGLDTDLCWGVFEKLYPIMPAEEVLIADMVHRMAIIPTLRLDRALLAEHLHFVKTEKQNLLASCGLDSQAGLDTLMSNDQFAAMLTRMGVDPPTKISPTTGKETWAFAKSDQSFKDLLEDDDPMVQAVVAARIGVKTTLEETRTERFLGLCNLTWPLHGTGLLPVALKVGGAHTHRLSGDWKMNTQNFRRASRKYPRAMLRESVVAPEGYVLLVGDSKQIECRTEATFLGQLDLVQQFANNEDPYSLMATTIFGYPVDKTKVAERFCGKTLVLGCGYQLWWPKYQASIKHLSEEQTGTPLILTDEQAEMHVRTYRRKNHNIVAGWKYALEVVIPAMTDPNCDFMWGPVRVMHEKIVGPTGLCLHYKDLHRTKEGEWLFTYGNFIKKLYGGKLVENVTQFLARIAVMQTALHIKDQMASLGAWLCMQAHDELVYCIPVGYAEHGKAVLLQGLRNRPLWMPGVPLDGEVSYATRYGLAK